MKILFLHDYLKPSGSTSATLGLMTALRARNHRVQIICLGGSRMSDFTRQAIVVKKIRKFGAVNALSRRFKRLVEHVRQFKPDIIQVEAPYMLKAAQNLSRIFNIPLTMMVHKFLSRKELKRDLLQNVRVITVSQALRAYLVNTAKIAKEQIVIIPDGIDPDKYQPDEVPPHKALTSIGMCGAYDNERGHACFLKAAKLLIEKERSVVFFVAGYGPDENPIKKMARDLGVYQHVTFIHDFPDLKKVLSLMDVFVIPSLKEGLGFHALEAMGMAKPVIASSVGGLMDVVTDEETGLLVQPDNPEKLAEKIEYLLDNPDEIVRMGKKGRTVIENTYNLTAMADAIVAEYKSLLTQGTVERV